MSENTPKKPAATKPKAASKSSGGLPARRGRAVTKASDPATTKAEVQRLSELGPEEKKRLLFEFASHQGWLPPPAMVREYEAILPGLAERIVAMPEREQAHRHQVVGEETKRRYRLKRRGQDYAVISIVVIIAFAVLLVFTGNAAWASRVVIATLVGIVGIFVTGKWFDREAEKADDEDEEGDEAV